MFKVKLVYGSGFDSDQYKKLEKALAKFENVMNSDQLKNKILSFTCSLGNRFEDNLGLNNQQVFEKLYAGKEFYDSEIDYTADLYLYRVKKNKPLIRKNRAIGFGNPGENEIYTYSWWLDDATDSEYAGHIAHEWAHKIGFDHSFNNTNTRDFSVPYAFGNIVEELAKLI